MAGSSIIVALNALALKRLRLPADGTASGADASRAPSTSMPASAS